MHIPIYRGAHTPYIMGYTYVADNAPCVNKKEGTKSRKKKRTTRHNVFYFIIMTTTCLCMCVHVHTIVVYMYIYIVYVGLDIADSVDVSSADDAKCLGTELRL